MADITNSIEELTASLRELTAHRSEGRGVEIVPDGLSVRQLALSDEVESFLQNNHKYAIQTRDVSVGSY